MEQAIGEEYEQLPGAESWQPARKWEPQSDNHKHWKLPATWGSLEEDSSPEPLDKSLVQLIHDFLKNVKQISTNSYIIVIISLRLQ